MCRAFDVCKLPDCRVHTGNLRCGRPRSKYGEVRSASKAKLMPPYRPSGAQSVVSEAVKSLTRVLKGHTAILVAVS